jgi:hypothetical protein
MAYFSGANIRLSIRKTYSFEDKIRAFEPISEAAGISFAISNSQQPIYGYASTHFDAMLPGREVVQGNLLINYTEPNYLLDKMGSALTKSVSSYTSFFSPQFDIKIEFLTNSGLNDSIIIEYCSIVNVGTTAQISDQPIIEEYSFIGRSLRIEEQG